MILKNNIRIIFINYEHNFENLNNFEYFMEMIRINI